MHLSYLKYLIIKHVNNYNLAFEKATNFLVEGCHISSDIIDQRPEEYLKGNDTPIGWIGIKLKMLQDNGDNTLIGRNNSIDKWFIVIMG